MSQKALKKRELLNLQRQEREQYQLYQHKQQTQTHVDSFAKNSSETSNLLATKNRFSSTPNIIAGSSTGTEYLADEDKSDNLYMRDDTGDLLDQSVVRGHSESDLTRIPENKILVNAKSEFHLKSIASTQVPTASARREVEVSIDGSNHTKTVSGTGTGAGAYKQQQQRKRVSNRSMEGSRIGSLTSSRSDSAQMQGSQCGFADTDHIRIPIVGYEVMEERARFTVGTL